MLQEYLQKLKDITNKAEDITKNNKLVAMDFSLHEGITSIKMKVNEIVDAINNGKLKGEKGDKGEDGAPGADGRDGADGERGPQGYRGEKGEQGERGPQGEIGPKGDKGDKGDIGETGPAGPKGDKGDKGDVGASGRDGVDGRDGIDGKNIELQRTDTHIQWRQEGQETWIDLIEIDELRAPAALNVDAYTKEETDQLIADAITRALQDVGVILEDYATITYVNEEIQKVQEQIQDVQEKAQKTQKQVDALTKVDAKVLTNTEVRPEFLTFEEHPDAVDRIKLIDKDGYSVAIEMFVKSRFSFYSNYSSTNTRLYWANNATTANVLYYRYENGQWVLKNKPSGTVHINIYTLKPIDDYLVESTVEIADSSNLDSPLCKKTFAKEIIADYNVANESTYYNVDHNAELLNAPATAIKGHLKNEFINDDILQSVYDEKTGKTYMRKCKNKMWSDWKIGATDMQTCTITNADGMQETYRWIEQNGIKTMFIDVQMSESEYNMGSNGLIMKTLALPEQAQIFDEIIMANITSYCRSDNNTLSRIVQNAEIISNVSVRGRWRHTDNTYPKIDRFTIMVTGI